ncbi:MAG TPA: FtsQ-type POTRA domain-containing protein [Candidatus Dormibacteraeota bacterium]|nr:FtsQ-type POTRA domain-containing protein [Candidatus Dormibacteraeota bacterium]
MSTGGGRRRSPAGRRSAGGGRDLAPPTEHRRGRGAPRRSRSSGAGAGLSLPTVTLSPRAVLRAAILLLEVVCLFVLVNQPVFASTQVEVSGAKHLSRQHILDRAGLSPGTSIFLVSTSAAQSELAGDPYVRSATVRTQLPNQVRIEVTEWEPLALVTRGNARYLLNEQGNVLTATTDVGLGRNPGQPRVPITEEDTAALAPGQSAINSRLVVDLDQMQSTFPSAYGLTVARFVIQSGGQLVVETTGGPRILFGQMVTPEQIDSLDAKLAALKSLSSQVDLGHSNLDYVTLENPNAPATHSIPSPSPSPKPSASPTKKP